MNKDNFGDERKALIFCHPNSKEILRQRVEKKSGQMLPDQMFVLCDILDPELLFVMSADDFENWLNEKNLGVWTTGGEE